MLERYTRPAMGQIWTLKNRYQAWLDVEIAATNAWAREGEVPREDAEKMLESLDDKHWLQERKGESKKCVDYCVCRDFCQFYKSISAVGD